MLLADALRGAALGVSVLTLYRIMTLVAWAAVALFMARGAWAAATGRGARYGDPMRLACFATAMVSICFTGRWFVAADNVFLWQLLYLLSVAVACYILVLGMRYGRGPKL